MRFRVKNNINYWNIIKDDLKVRYKRIRTSNTRVKESKNILDNSNFRNNQNYIISDYTINNSKNRWFKNTMNVFFTTIAFTTIWLYFWMDILVILVIWSFIIALFILFYWVYTNIKKDVNIFNIKEMYHKKHFIYIKDK